MQLPCWTKRIFGEAFFGPISGLKLTKSSIEQLPEIGFTETVYYVHIPDSQVSGDDIRCLSQNLDIVFVDMPEVHVNYESLSALAEMPSVGKIQCGGDAVSALDASEIVARHPGLDLLLYHADRGWHYAKQ